MARKKELSGDRRKGLKELLSNGDTFVHSVRVTLTSTYCDKPNGARILSSVSV